MNSTAQIKSLYTLFSPCYLCPLNCGVSRLKGERGICNAGVKMKISSATLYFGEEPPLVGSYGSGAIFFSYCNLKCVYCQNYNFSQNGVGKYVSITKLAKIMLELQERGAANINLITATHFLPQAVSTIKIARKNGLNLPIVYNTSGYESVAVLKLLKGFIDIYLTDFRYGTNEWAVKYSSAPFYTEVVSAALKEMYSQVGNLKVNRSGIAKRGLIIRHLLFPNGLNELTNSLKLIKKAIGTDVYISLMSQYVPVFKAMNYKEIDRRISKNELLRASFILRKFGFKNGWIQYL